MKKQFFTFLMMIALVIVAGKAMAQGSTALQPWIGSSHTYTFSGLTNGDNYAFSINQSGTSTAHVVNATIYSPGTLAGTVAGNKAELQVTWNGGDGTTTYNIWITVSGADGCSNYRYVTVTPQSTYIVNFNVLALETNNVDRTIAQLDGVTGAVSIDADCFDPSKYIDPTDLQSNTGTGANGSVYVYYKITRTAANAGQANIAWSFDPTGAAGVTAWEYNNAGTWTSTAMGVINVPSGTNVLYMRGVVQVTDTDIAASLNLNGATPVNPEDAGGQVDYDLTDNSAVINIDKVSIIGGFTGN